MDSGSMMPIDDIVARVRQSHRPLILVTGGEPLVQKACIALLEALLETGAIIQLETSGALDIRPVPAHVRKILDIKTPGSGEASRNRWSNLDHLQTGDEIKFVLTSRADYDWSLACIRDRKLDELEIPILFSPCWGDLEAQQLSNWMLEDNPPARLLLQQHKSIWGAEVTRV